MVVSANSKTEASGLAVEVWNDAESETPNIRVDLMEDTFSHAQPQVLHVVNYKEE